MHSHVPLVVRSFFSMEKWFIQQRGPCILTHLKKRNLNVPFEFSFDDFTSRSRPIKNCHLYFKNRPAPKIHIWNLMTNEIVVTNYRTYQFFFLCVKQKSRRDDGPDVFRRLIPSISEGPILCRFLFVVITKRESRNIKLLKYWEMLFCL